MPRRPALALLSLVTGCLLGAAVPAAAAEPVLPLPPLAPKASPSASPAATATASPSPRPTRAALTTQRRAVTVSPVRAAAMEPSTVTVSTTPPASRLAGATLGPQLTSAWVPVAVPVRTPVVPRPVVAASQPTPLDASPPGLVATPRAPHERGVPAALSGLAVLLVVTAVGGHVVARRAA